MYELMFACNENNATLYCLMHSKCWSIPVLLNTDKSEVAKACIDADIATIRQVLMTAVRATLQHRASGHLSKTITRVLVKQLNTLGFTLPLSLFLSACFQLFHWFLGILFLARNDLSIEAPYTTGIVQKGDSTRLSFDCLKLHHQTRVSKRIICDLTERRSVWVSDFIALKSNFIWWLCYSHFPNYRDNDEVSATRHHFHYWTAVPHFNIGNRGNVFCMGCTGIWVIADHFLVF